MSPFNMLVSAAAGCAGAVASLTLIGAMVWLTNRPDKQGRQVYEPARWVYPAHAQFDNTFPTYSTDYIITAVCYSLALLLLQTGRGVRVRLWAALLLLINGSSTLIGGAAHQHYSGNAVELNTSNFYWTWASVVGLTVSAGGVTGLLATALLRDCSRNHPLVQLLSVPFWLAWNSCLLAAVLVGHLSYSRPACDIFVAGVTQSGPVGLLCYAVHHASVQTTAVSRGSGLALLLFVLINAPLIFAYPHLVNHFNLGVTNTVLHAVLLVAWAGQGLCLRTLCVQLERRAAIKKN